MSTAGHESKTLKCDVVVVGAGIAGLLTARRLADTGYTVIVVESAGQVMSGASIRNEGWLHAGTYHSCSIRDADQALSVAKRCRYGWSQLQTDYPECVESESHSAVALVREDRVADAVARWDAAGVAHTEATGSHRRALDEDVVVAPFERAFAVQDRSINTRMLGARVLADVVRAGGLILLDSEPVSLAGGELSLSDGTCVLPRITVLATGYRTQEVCERLALPSPTIRLWQSHLAVLPVLSAMSVFSIAPGEAAMANHASWSVVGLNEDARLVDEPTFEPRAEASAALLDAVRARFRRCDESRAHITSCVKVDVREPHDAARSLNVQVSWLGQDVLSLLPGKMTEAPYAADHVTRLVFDRLVSDSVAERPLEAHHAATLSRERA